MALADRDLHRDAVDDERPRIGRSVPYVDRVVRPSSQCPDGEVETQRRADLDREACGPHGLLACFGHEQVGEHGCPRTLDIAGRSQRHEATVATGELL